MGVIEKHGPHLPLGTDVMAVRALAVRAAQQEYAVVFPEYYFGQINCARHEPGCVSVRPELLNSLLQSVCDEIARNGFHKIVILNGHGGNTQWLHFFCQLQLSERRPYVVHLAEPRMDEETRRQLEKMRETDVGGHACEMETSGMLAVRPDLVQLDRAGDEDGSAQRRLKGVPDVFTGIWWYADFPHHYAGDGSPATAQKGELALNAAARALAKILRSVKRDTIVRKLQDDFHEKAAAPVRARRTPTRR
jgi:creatinine amidohydrolase